MVNSEVAEERGYLVYSEIHKFRSYSKLQEIKLAQSQEKKSNGIFKYI